MSRRTLSVYEAHGVRAEAGLALEEDLLELAGRGRPVLLVGSWMGPVVVLGYGQPEDDVDLEWCRTSGIPVLRRISGGTGVVHDRDLAVTLSLPGDHPWARGVRALYGRFLGALAAALEALGARPERVADGVPEPRQRSPICFEDQGSDTIALDGRKAVGCAQARRSGAVLVHAAVLLDLDPALWAGVFRVDPARIRRALAPAIPGGEPVAVGRAVAAAVAEGLEAEPSLGRAPAPSPAALARFRDPRWAPVRPPRPSVSGIADH